MEDSDDEEEELIVYANFEDGTVEKEIFQIPNVKLKIIGLDSDTPVVQLRDSTFKGKWNDTIGTKILLEEDPSPEQADPTFTATPEVMLKYKCQTGKSLDLSRIFLKPKSNLKPDESKENGEDCEMSSQVDCLMTYPLEDVVQSTIKPDPSGDHLMKNIVNEAIDQQNGI